MIAKSASRFFGQRQDRSGKSVRQVTGSGVAGTATEVAQGTLSSVRYPRLLHAGSETWIAFVNLGTGKIQTVRFTK